MSTVGEDRPGSSDDGEGTGGIVDSHVHLLPPRLAAKVRSFFEMGGPVDFAYPLDHHEVADRLAGEGISAVWTLPYAHKAGVASWLNDEAAATAAHVTAIDVIAGATTHPGDDDPVAIVRTAVEGGGGARVLKLHCSVGDFDATDERLEGVWSYVEAVSLPVVVHVGHSVMGTTEADELGPVAEVARRHPAAPIVVAHCGHGAVAETLDLLRAHPNVHADLTPVMWGLVDISPAAADELSAKLLFGTDTPNTPLAATTCLAHLDSLGPGPAARAAIAGDNARRLVAAVRT